MEDGVRDATEKLVDALARGDAPAAAALYADDGTLMTPTAEIVHGQRHIEAYWRAGIGLGLSRFVLEMSELRIDRETALELGAYRLAFDRASDRGRYLVLHRRQLDGTWRRAVDVFISNRKGA